MKDPTLRYKCPRCGAPIGHPCITRHVTISRDPHQLRVKRWLRAVMYGDKPIDAARGKL